MAIALVLGCNGQDGTFLCRHLLRRGHTVVGVGKQPLARFSYADQPFTYVSIDLATGSVALSDLLIARRPDLVFHVAAVHASASSAQYEGVFQQMLPVNLGSFHVVLEYLRLYQPAARALYASSAKVFGTPLPSRVDEQSARVSQCLYSVTKNAAGDLLRYYRGAHGCLASQLFLFNHESELRPASFFIPKLARVLAAGVRGEPAHEAFASLDFYCDWGVAEEYMDIAIDCLERAPAEDFVMATGRCLYARELVGRLADEYALDQRAWIQGSASRPGQSPYQVQTTKLQDRVGRVPQTRIEVLVRGLTARELDGTSPGTGMSQGAAP